MWVRVAVADARKIRQSTGVEPQPDPLKWWVRVTEADARRIRQSTGVEQQPDPLR